MSVLSFQTVGTEFRLPCFFFTLAPNSCVTTVSHSVKQVLGYEADQMIGTPISEFFAGRDAVARDPGNTLFPEQWAVDASDLGAIDQCLCAFRAADGSKRIVRISSAETRSLTGDPPQRESIAMDVTAQFEKTRQLQESIEKLDEKKQRLTAREQQVLDLMVAGALNKQIADKIGVSLRTVEGDRRRIIEKYGVDSPAQVIAMEAELRTLQVIVSHETCEETSPADNGMAMA